MRVSRWSGLLLGELAATAGSVSFVDCERATTVAGNTARPDGGFDELFEEEGESSTRILHCEI